MGKLFLIFLIGLSFSGCSTQWVGTSESEFITPPGCEISPDQALALAEPWLDQTFQLRSEMKVNRAGMNRPLVDTIVLSGNWYYVSRDNYPFKSIYAYKNHAVKIHKKNGRIIPPK